MDDNKFFGCLGLLAGLVGVIIVASIANGWAISVLWGWFIVPLFNLPALTIVQAIGVSLVIGMFTYKRQQSTSETRGDAIDKLLGAFAEAVATPIFALFFGRFFFLFL